jgi:hypothetical protein
MIFPIRCAVMRTQLYGQDLIAGSGRNSCRSAASRFHCDKSATEFRSLPLPPMVPAVASAAVAAIWPRPVKATASAVAAVSICGRSRNGCTERGYPGHAQDLCSDVAEGVGENDRHHRQAAHQKCSDALTMAFTLRQEKVRKLPRLAKERVSMPAVPSETAFDLSLSVIAPAELHARVRRSDA